jgi:virginiamycin B lyase
VWYTAQGSGELGWLDPATGETRHGRRGDRAAPHGVILGPDGAPWVTAPWVTAPWVTAPWVTDGGLNALVRFDPAAEAFDAFPHPRPNAQVRQLLGHPEEVWGARSGQVGLVVARRAA